MIQQAQHSAYLLLKDNMAKIAVRTLLAIEDAIQKDQGASFRVWLGKVLPHIGDAYRGGDDGFRGHLGASILGEECARKLWYGFRWVHKSVFEARTLRLFNRGHLEEGRFIAILLAAGIQVWQQDSNQKQFRISELGGHLGGSLDGIALGIPDIPSGEQALVEFKTHNDKSFKSLVKDGLRSSKPMHYVQKQIYMRKKGLRYGLYMAVNKNDDSLYAEIIELDETIADKYLERGRRIIMLRSEPDRMSGASPSFYLCKFCDYNEICYRVEKPVHNCRTCAYSVAVEDGTWICNSTRRRAEEMFRDSPEEFKAGETMILSMERQTLGCQTYYDPLIV